MFLHEFSVITLSFLRGLVFLLFGLITPSGICLTAHAVGEHVTRSRNGETPHSSKLETLRSV